MSKTDRDDLASVYQFDGGGNRGSTDELLSRDDIERETHGGITRRWLELAAHRGDGPPFLKISRRMVRYRRVEFNAWLEAQRIAPQDAG